MFRHNDIMESTSERRQCLSFATLLWVLNLYSLLEIFPNSSNLYNKSRLEVKSKQCMQTYHEVSFLQCQLEKKFDKTKEIDASRGYNN